MILNFLMLIAASFAMGCLTAYGLWCWLRGPILRQDLFVMRDRLWDEAQRRGRLDDAAYRMVRERLHVFIAGGPYVSVPMMAAILKSGSKTHIPKRPESEDPEFEAILKDCEYRSADRIWRYVSKDRFASYWIWYAYIGGRKMVRQLFSNWLQSDGPWAAARLSQYAERAHAA